MRDWDDWKHEDSAPPQASMAHILSGSCAGNKVAARNFMRELDKQAARATARVERTAPDSKRHSQVRVAVDLLLRVDDSTSGRRPKATHLRRVQSRTSLCGCRL